MNGLSSSCLTLADLRKEYLQIHFLMSQFSYFSLAWMFHSGTKNNKTTILHKRCLRVIQNDRTSSFEELFEKERLVSIHTRNLLILATEIESLQEHVTSYYLRNILIFFFFLNFFQLCLIFIPICKKVYIMEDKVYHTWV